MEQRPPLCRNIPAFLELLCLAGGICRRRVEMPGVYEPGELDLAGTIVGVVERDKIINGSTICPGDVIVGLPSTGLHTNGYSLARRVLDGLDWQATHPALGISIGEALLAVHRCYLEPVQQLWAAGVNLRGLAHITGGGFVDNLPRVLPASVGAVIRRGAWPELPIFGLIQQQGEIPFDEMFHVFNMGLGMLIVVPPGQVSEVQAVLADVYVVGEIVGGKSGVSIV